jgi:drug/metabolite transporter (DMT)-like permease
MEHHEIRTGLLLAAAGVLTFSFSLPMTKIAVRGMDPTIAGVGRATIASVLAAATLLITRSPRPTLRQFRRLVVVAGGVVFGFPMLTAYALHHTPSLHGSVVTGLLPLATAGGAVMRAGERPSPTYWACSSVGFAAVVGFVIHEGGGTLHLADVLLVLAVISASVGYTEGALLAREMSGWRVISWALVIAAPATWIVTGLAVARHHPDATAGQWAAFLYTCTATMFFGFFAWYAGLARAGIARAGQLQLAQPVLSLIWGWPLLGERLSGAAVVTIVVVVGAVAIGRRSAVTSRASPTAAAALEAAVESEPA